MKAIRIESHGGPEVLQLVDIPKPAPGEGQVLVKAHAIGVGKPDVLLRTGVYRWMPPMPAVPGTEMAGTIAAVGPGVSAHRVGDRVMVYHLKAGCYAEYAVVPASDATPLTDGIAFEDAVSIPNYQVAWALVHRAARGVEVKSLYVNGAAGGVGSAVIQLARLEGITVVAGASSDAKCEFARSQGAQHAINYSREKVAARVLEMTDNRGVDLVLDHLVGPSFTENLDMLASMGMIVSFNALGGLPDRDLFREMRAHLPGSPAVRCFTMHSYDRDPAGKAELAANVASLLAQGKVKPAIHARLPLAEARRAHQMLDAREVLGKLVLVP